MSISTPTATGIRIKPDFNADRMGNVLARIEEIKKTKRDYIFPADTLGMKELGRLHMGSKKLFQVGEQVFTEWDDAEKEADALGVIIDVLGGDGAGLELSTTAEVQLAQTLGIPVQYVRKLSAAGHEDLAAHNFDTLMHRSEKKHLVRTLDGKVRAFLSNKYKVMDNYDLFFSVAETVKSVGAEVWHCRLSDDHFSMTIVNPDVMVSIGKCREHQFADLEDLHSPAVRIDNSETGNGGLHVRTSILRKACSNLCVVERSVSQIHLGRETKESGLIEWGQDTKESEANTIFLKCRDAIKSAFDVETFKTRMAGVEKAKYQEIGEPEKAVEAVAETYNISEERRARVLRELFSGGDLSRFGLAQAVTSAAQIVESEDPDEAGRFEEIGGELLMMSDSGFSHLVGAK